MKHQIIKGFTQFINENYSDEPADNSVSPEQHSSNLDRLRQLGIVNGVATAYAGNSNEEMLRLTFSTSDEEVLISLDSLADIVDIDDESEEGLAAINQALFTKAEQIAKSHGCSVLIEDETDSEYHLYEAANENTAEGSRENVELSPEQREANLERLRQLGVIDWVATAHLGNSRAEQLYLTFSNSDDIVLISLNSVADVVVDLYSKAETVEGRAEIRAALWARAEEIAKSKGCSTLIDEVTGAEYNLYEAANENANLNRLRQLGIADHEWRASMIIDFDYIYDGTPDGVKALFMESAKNAGEVKINLESVDIDDWTDENTEWFNEDGEIEIDYGLQASIYFTFTTSLTNESQIKEALESTFPNNIFMYVDELSRLDSAN